MNQGICRSLPGPIRLGLVLSVLLAIACGETTGEQQTVLHWYVFDEPSGAFEQAADRCQTDDYRISVKPLPTDADQQREQLARRLAAADSDIDIIGMDVIWTAEFASAGWLRPWQGEAQRAARHGRIEATVRSARYKEQLWGIPFTTNIQLLWYRRDRVATPPQTWQQMIDVAESLADEGTIEAQGHRYEGLTVFFTSLLASAGGAILDETGRSVNLQTAPTRAALEVMRRLANSPASDPALATSREDDARLGFESGRSSFMVNYTYVWPSAKQNAPRVAGHMQWARWPRVDPTRPSRVTIGGINLGIGAFSAHPVQAFAAARCIASAENQRRAARQGGLPPTIAALYDEPGIREVFPFADTLRASLRDAVQRPQTPLYYDVSLAISHTLHPMRDIDPQRDVDRLRQAVARALRSEALL